MELKRAFFAGLELRGSSLSDRLRSISAGGLLRFDGLCSVDWPMQTH